MTVVRISCYGGECGNITEAAEKLYISQPSLSIAIHNLEKNMTLISIVLF
ncbi:MAG: LysR family transcriptional regulator [Eubacterium sp.]|nr:LysR family transcriptional regulator [Eubacterium sp.]